MVNKYKVQHLLLCNILYYCYINDSIYINIVLIDISVNVYINLYIVYPS